jgi:L-fucose mutarotase/ribose pyranase (RbsD/FucU family)
VTVPDTPRVSYDVKELLKAIDLRLASIDSKLDAKADVREVLELRDRIATLEKRWQERMAVEQAERARNSQMFSRREKIGALLIASFAVLSTSVQQHLHF